MLSPPGMMRPSHRASSWAVRTSMTETCSLSRSAALRTRLMCSMKPPWRARTPMVRRIMARGGGFLPGGFGAKMWQGECKKGRKGVKRTQITREHAGAGQSMR